MRIYSLYDRTAHEFGQLTLFQNDETCKRALIQAFVSKPREYSTFHESPGDFDVKCLGVIDMARGKIQPEEIPVMVCNVGKLVAPLREQAAAVVPPRDPEELGA